MTFDQGQLRRPQIFGIVNITPDSFSDGGDFLSPAKACAQAEKLFADGADVVDIGAESTKPGSLGVSADDEWYRLEPVLRSLCDQNRNVRVSVDTRKFSVMRRAAELGCGWINSVGPLPNEEELLELKRLNPQIGYIATHIHGTPQDMQLNPLGPSKALQRVEQFFESSKAELEAAGFSPKQQFYDPGIGFGKTDPANVSLLARAGVWSRDYPVAVGLSRKGFLGRLFGLNSVKERDPVSKALELSLALSGVEMIRTHDVTGLVQCLRGAGVGES